MKLRRNLHVLNLKKRNICWMVIPRLKPNVDSSLLCQIKCVTSRSPKSREERRREPTLTDFQALCKVLSIQSLIESSWRLGKRVVH